MKIFEKETQNKLKGLLNGLMDWEPTPVQGMQFTWTEGGKEKSAFVRTQEQADSLYDELWERLTLEEAETLDMEIVRGN